MFRSVSLYLKLMCMYIKIFIDEFTLANICRNPPIIFDMCMYLPFSDSSGSQASASIRIAEGTKQAINNDEIVTTIFATFKLRLEILSDTVVDIVVCLHSFWILSWFERMAVQRATIINVHMGIKKLLIENVNISTWSLFSLKINPTIDSFFTGENFTPRLLTQYAGLALNVKMMKIQTMITAALFEVMTFFTYVETVT